MTIKRDFNSQEYKTWRKAVYRRDGYRCQFPGCGKKKRLAAHHIKRHANFESLRFVVSNGISLCYDCHKKVTGREEQFEELFTRIVARKTSINPEILRIKYTGKSFKDII